MDRAVPHPSGLFAEHHIELADTHVETAITQQLSETGIVTVSGLTTRDAVLAFADRLMAITAHRDSDPDGLTTIRDTGRHAHLSGFAGFGSGELSAHTERSSTPAPPRLLLLVCARPAAAGGEVLLADGREVFADLIRHEPEAAVRLSEPRTAFFGAGDGHASQVFALDRDGRLSVRLRLDSLARFSPLVVPYLPQLRSAIARTQRRMSLGAGQGYLVDNHRWLHARTRFFGDRLCWRALGEPRFPLAAGFAPHSAVTVPKPLESV